MPPRNFLGQFSSWPTDTLILVAIFLLIGALENLP